MKTSIGKIRFVCAALVLVCCGAIALAQSAKDSFVIYAKAGRINLAEGSARLQRTGADAGQVVAVGDELGDGNLITTGADTRVEVLLSPGSYLRLNSNAKFRMVSTELDDIRLELIQGSAVIETGGGPDDVLRVQVAFPAGSAVIKQRGIYRFNVDGPRSELLVLKGRTTIEPSLVAVKDGQRLAANGRAMEPVAKFDKKTSRDALDIWSRDRADYLAKANRSLDGRQLAAALNSYRALDGFDFGLRNGGFWLFSSRHRNCVFVPWDPWNWQSGYGFDFSNGNHWGWGSGYPGNGYPGNTGGSGSGSTTSMPVKPLDPGPPIGTAPINSSPRGDSVKPQTPMTKGPGK